MHAYEAHFFESGAWQFATDLPFDREQPGHLADQLRPADQRRLQVQLAHPRGLCAGRLARRRQAAGEPRPAVRPRHEPADERRLCRCWRTPPTRAREVREQRPRHRRQQPAAALRRHLRRPGRRHARGARRLGSLHHAQPPLLRPDVAGPPARHRGPDRGSAQLQNYPDIKATLGGKSLSDYVTTGAARSVYIIPDDYVLPESQNTTAGFGWQFSDTTGIEMDYVHAYGYNQLGAIDLNLPATGRISATNPRPVRLHGGQEPRELHQELVRRARDPVPYALQGPRQPVRCPTRSRAHSGTA